MPRLRVSWVDVFTDRPFAGNPLAVVLGADDLDTAQMQRLAAEFNLSETTFVLEGARRLRIFTPGSELPLAGHPVVGAVVELGRLGELEDGAHVFETGAGQTPVELADGVATMTQPDLRIHGDLDPAACADLLGLDPADVLGTPVICETAVPQAFAQVRDRSTLARVRPHYAGIGTLGNAIGIAAWCEHDGELAQRFFVDPGLGIAEDPATGSAAGALGALRVAQGADPGRVTIRQGEEVGRPSRILVDIGGEPGNPREVRCGGTAVPVLEAVTVF